MVIEFLLDFITNGKASLIINTPAGKYEAIDDSLIRKAAVKTRTPYITTMAAAKAAAEGIQNVKFARDDEVTSLQEFHNRITDK